MGVTEKQEATAPWMPSGSCPFCGSGDLVATRIVQDAEGKVHVMGVERQCDCATSANRYDIAIGQVREDLDRLRGRLFECLEAFGLEHRHEEAAKRLVRRMTYDMQSNLEATLRRNAKEDH